MSDTTQPSSHDENQVELEFVQRILSSEGYCWEPGTPAGEAYLDQLEQVWLSESVEVEQSALDEAPFYQALNQSWERLHARSSLENRLTQSLGDRVPQTLLQTLIAKAQQVLYTEQSLRDQLVQCVQGIVPQLDVDDLQVVARPYALAMRDYSPSPSLETLHSSVRAAPWSELVPLERARLGLAVSRYILSELPHHIPTPPHQ